MIGSPDLLAFTGAEGFGEEEEEELLPEELSVPLLPPDNPWSSSARSPETSSWWPSSPSRRPGPRPARRASSGPRLNFSEDSRVILGDSAEDAFAYVHHMTLYDLEARGMVRPFCLAYVCSDQMKLMENFPELSARFSQASDSLKTGNRQAFSNELQRKLHELEFTRLTLLQESKPQSLENGVSAAAGTAEELEAVEHLISNHRELLRQPLPELCNAYFLSLMKEQLAEAERRLRGPGACCGPPASPGRCPHHSARSTSCLSCARSGGRRGGLQAEAGTKSAAHLLPSDPMSLESFFSCVEEIPIKLEAGEVEEGTPGQEVAMEMAGSVTGSDTSRCSRRRETPPAATDTPDGGVRHARTYARRENSEDSIEVLSTADSIFPDDLAAITEEEAEQHLLEEEEEVPEAADPGNHRDTCEAPGPAPACARSSRGEADATRTSKRWRGSVWAPERRLCSRSSFGVEPAGAWRSACGVDGAGGRALASSRRSSQPDERRPGVRPRQLHHLLGPALPRPLRPQQLARLGRAEAAAEGGGAKLRFLRQNSFSQHAVFCLLSGRPLVVVGGEEASVRSLVEALSLFLPAPGLDGNAVMACLTSPLQVTDLLVWRLMGIHRGRFTALRTLARSSAAWLRLPPASRHGGTYLLHLESGLSALTNQALLYTFCSELQRLNRDGDGTGPVLGDYFLLARGYGGQDDLSVMHFLSDLLRQRHAGRGPPFLRFSYRSRQLHRNTHVL
ncbi:unnamed protein product [Tetraodon nigroviridis]|uniref:(spotted green pufferfish) hypothetical protein n=1 Tax=Tetraodon nigroviridis TaxID=99883 RepID=Q4SMI0_TETNG|nr:unnamed protein product [Tetraodon nigroviridis]